MSYAASAYDFHDKAAGYARLVQELAGVLFEMQALDADALRVVGERQLAALRQGAVELADLVALGQVGVEVVLARENRAPHDARIDRQSEFDGHADHSGCGC